MQQLMLGRVIVAPEFAHRDRAIAMRHPSLLLALAAASLFIGLFLGSNLISDASAATAGHALAVSVDDFNYIDTSNEPTDQTAVHEKRLRAFMTALRDDVTADRRFELVPSSCAPNCPTEGPALGDRLRAASQAGTQILIIGIVHKRSTLVQVVWAVAIDTTTQRVVFKKFFTFRGDNDEAWQRAERFVSEEVRDRLLESGSQQ
jgi:Protein of unknown function (DUF2380)